MRILKTFISIALCLSLATFAQAQAQNKTQTQAQTQPQSESERDERTGRLLDAVGLYTEGQIASAAERFRSLR